MKKFFKKIQADTIGQVCFWGTLLFIAGSLCLIAIFYHVLPPFLPLYNHMPWGYARLGRTFEIFIPICVAVVLSIINSIVGVNIRGKEPLLARFVFIATLVISFFTFVFLIRLLQVVR